MSKKHKERIKRMESHSFKLGMLKIEWNNFDYYSVELDLKFRKKHWVIEKTQKRGFHTYKYSD